MFINEFSKLAAFAQEKSSLEAGTLGLIKMAVLLAMDKPEEAKALMLEYKNAGGGQDNIDAVFAIIASAKLSYIYCETVRNEKPSGSSSCCS
ncbi:hypothetical protein [Pantoea agglomerans]|uniref:hypothetical protein n=1 Tax=Enterobacter agglomerans TaxID=549 RepID=UPI0015FC8A2B|nr:hypothetical protein [Pantoea agglomerans]MBA8894309.1 hypothetical protein [Pantoea agglomerans]WEC75203.1 hypothetical protein LDO72_23465 [Pantoea agglomerans]WNK37996.1 hypothetical protein RM158_24025 [Pantoea agglomerans]WNK74134.1 hypothetical protein RM155_23480 [Pantoea agglomerans]